MSKIGLFLGHSILKSGSITSADGRKYSGVNEYLYNKSLIGLIQTELEKTGHNVDVIKCPEKQFTASSQERNYKIPIANSGDYVCIVELHLNASENKTAKGAEVLYYPTSKGGKKLATAIQDELKEIYYDRGIKSRNNLYMLSQTKPVSVIVESFFCTNPEDCKKATKGKLARAIAKGIDNYLQVE